jgi:predicted lipoprotein with Yx(FWY)xxD motif
MALCCERFLFFALRRILVNSSGRTLYLFEKDRKGMSACTGQCASLWPPLLTKGKPRAIGGAKASLLGTTRRANGGLQVTYNHHPLYTFAEDTKKGQTKGEGMDAFGAEWYALSAAGAKVVKASPPPRRAAATVRREQGTPAPLRRGAGGRP